MYVMIIITEEAINLMVMGNGRGFRVGIRKGLKRESEGVM